MRYNDSYQKQMMHYSAHYQIDAKRFVRAVFALRLGNDQRCLVLNDTSSALPFNQRYGNGAVAKIANLESWAGQSAERNWYVLQHVDGANLRCPPQSTLVTRVER